jgi:hypothetical protein
MPAAMLLAPTCCGGHASFRASGAFTLILFVLQYFEPIFYKYGVDLMVNGALRARLAFWACAVPVCCRPNVLQAASRL